MLQSPKTIHHFSPTKRERPSLSALPDMDCAPQSPLKSSPVLSSSSPTLPLKDIHPLHHQREYHHQHLAHPSTQILTSTSTTEQVHLEHGALCNHSPKSTMQRDIPPKVPSPSHKTHLRPPPLPLPLPPSTAQPPLPPAPRARAHATFNPNLSLPSLPIPFPFSSALSRPRPQTPPSSRGTKSACRPLPLLDLGAVTSFATAGLDDGAPGSARTSVRRITSSLSTVRPRLHLGTQTSLLQLGTAPRDEHPTLVVNFASASTPHLDMAAAPPAARRSHHLCVPLRDDPLQPIDHVLLPAAARIATELSRHRSHHNHDYQHHHQRRRCRPRRRGCVKDTADGDGRVAIVCAQGISRSAAVCIAYLMLAEGLTFEEALADARRARAIVAPNAGFVDALLRLETRQRFGRARDSAGIVRSAGVVPASVSGALRDEDEEEIEENTEMERDDKKENDEDSDELFVAEELRPNQGAARDAEMERVRSGQRAVVMEHARRAGVTVWLGSAVPERERRAATRLAEDMAAQQMVDARRFGGPQDGAGTVRVVRQGEGDADEARVWAALGVAESAAN